jgi:subtilisin family serine protease
MASARGHLIVAAVGNDGPAAPPLYPAAYPGVVAVTGVDRADKVLIEAGRGKFVAFAAPGADIEAASLPSGYMPVRGTSFAAPIVASRLALLLGRPDRVAAERAVSELAASAVDLGSPGRDSVYGNGCIGCARMPSSAAPSRRGTDSLIERIRQLRGQ